jgi:iron(III) transport system ATP-binding protein
MGIDVTALWKSYGDTAAVAGIDLHVPQGEMLVLLGPSGCGKTTTMRCIAGLETPENGRIALAGRTVFDGARKINVPVNERHLGMVFQSYAIWPHMTVFENVSFPLEMERRPRSEIASRVTDMLKTVGIEGLADRSASRLSGGQMQRVALARSMVMQPTVLLFDEPLSNLDARLRDHLRVQLRELQMQLNITGIYVTHDQQEALALADRIVVMQSGRVLQDDDPVSLYCHPKTSVIADFLGYNNIFDAQIIDHGGGGCRVALAGSGHRLAATGGPADAVREVAACVRPDDIAIRLFPDEGPLPSDLPDNTLAGEVLLASFMGTYMLYRVQVGVGQVWEVLCSSISNDIQHKARVILEIPPANVFVLPKY